MMIALMKRIAVLLFVVQSGAARDGPPPEHYIFFGRDRERIREPSFYRAGGVVGAQLTYAWSELEPERNHYAVHLILTDLAFLERHGKRLWVQLQDVSFDSAIVNVPMYLRTDPDFHGGMARQSSGRDDGSRVAEGWVARRWDPAVRARFVRLINVLADSLDGRIAGINFAETSIGIARRGPLSAEGYSPAGYADAIREVMTAAGQAFDTSVVIQYANFMPGEELPDDDRGYLRGTYTHAPIAGVGVGGPDLLPWRWFQRQHSLPLIAARAPGTPAGLAVQWGNLDDRHRRTGVQITVPDLYAYATDTLRLDYIFWGTQEPYYSRDILPFLETLR